MIYLKKRNCKIILFLVTLVLIFGISCNVFAIKPYQKVDFVTGLVTATNLNVRSGPSTAYSVVTRGKKERICSCICTGWKFLYNPN